MKNNNLSRLIDRYLDKLEIKNPAATNNYRHYLRRFLDLTSAAEPEEVNSANIRRFRIALNKLKSDKGGFLDSATKNYHLIALRSFLRFLNQEKINVLDYQKIELLPQENKIKTILSRQEVNELLAAPLKSSESEMIKIRDKAILEILFSTRLKVSKLTALIKSERVTEKNSNQASYYLNLYLKKRKDRSPYLFIRHDRAKTEKIRPLTARSIQRMISAYAKMSNIGKKVTPETLRQVSQS